MVTIPIGLDDEIVKKIDALVKQGRYKNRTELIRDQIIKGVERLSVIEEEPQLDEKIKPFLDKLLQLEKPPDILRVEGSVAELVSKERDR